MAVKKRTKKIIGKIKQRAKPVLPEKMAFMTITKHASPKQGHAFYAAFAYAAQLLNIVLLGLGAVIALILLLVRDKKFTKFHSAQAFFLGILIVLATFVASDAAVGNGIFNAIQFPYIYVFFAMLLIVVILFMMHKAFNNEWYELPLFGKLAKHLL